MFLYFSILKAYKDQLKLGAVQKVRAWFELKSFDIILLYDRFIRWASTVSIQLLILVGMISSEIAEEIKKAEIDHTSSFNNA